MTTLCRVTPLPTILGIAELGTRWGIGRTAVGPWVKREDFPRPGELAMGPVWAEEDVRAWEDERAARGLPLPGQKPRGREPSGGR